MCIHCLCLQKSTTAGTADTTALELQLQRAHIMKMMTKFPGNIRTRVHSKPVGTLDPAVGQLTMDPHMHT